MDDFVLANLHESRNEWCSRLVSIFTPLVNEGIKSIFEEACNLCNSTNESEKYLMSFQNFLSRVPSWNNNIIETECTRIVERSGCNYLEDLITCVHIIQLKVLTCVRVGNRQKKIDISIPNIETFVHKVYINSARKIYSNVYLLDKKVTPLQAQKNNRELEIIIQECILTTIRDSIPTEQIIRAYMDESEELEEEVTIEEVDKSSENKDENKNSEEDKEEFIEKPQTDSNDSIDTHEKPIVPSITNIDNDPVVTKLTFNDYDAMHDADTGSITNIEAPKNIERLEEISTSRAIQRKLEEEDDDDDKIKISTDSLSLDNLDFVDIDNSNDLQGNNLVLSDVEVLA